jgi:hypothetical protein
MVTYFEFPAGNYKMTPSGWEPDMLEVEDVASLHVDDEEDTTFKLHVESDHLDDLVVSLTLTRMSGIRPGLPLPAGATASVVGKTVIWVHSTSVPNGALLAYTAHFAAPVAGTFAFTYRVEAAQLATPVEYVQSVTVAP